MRRTAPSRRRRQLLAAAAVVAGVLASVPAPALGAGALPNSVTSHGPALQVDPADGVSPAAPLFVVRGGQVRWVFNTSTGTEQPYTYEGVRYVADTPPGRWTVYREVDGVRQSNLGRLYRPRYFHTDGIAVHGYPFVPPYPLSHGCVRVTNAAMDFIWSENLMPVGSLVWVHGARPVAS